MTGYVSQDKPQYRYYKSEPCRMIKAEQSLYDLVTVTNKDNSRWPAIRYLDRSWTFGQLKKLTDRLADALVKAGLKQGETVLLALNSGIETVLCLLAINKIGAISKWVDMRTSEDDFRGCITASGCRFAFVFEQALPAVRDACSMVETVITVSPVEMLPLWARLAYYRKNPVTGRENPGEKPAITGFRRFLLSGDPRSRIKQLPFDKSRPSVIVQSGGTTGKPKNTVHSDYSVVCSVRNMTYSDLPILPKETVLNNLPPWVAYSLGQGILWPLACGASVLFEPKYNREDAIYRNIGKFSVCFGVPYQYRGILARMDRMPESKKQELYKVRAFISGGDKIGPSENRIFESVLRDPVINGYGKNECFGCLTVNCMGHNRYGSVGIPKHGEIIISYDNERECELPYGEVGELCACVDSEFLCYEGNEEDTALVKRVHKDGKTWIHTGDLGMIDEEGFVFLKGRLCRVITWRGAKISAYTIEDAVSKVAEIKECIAVQVRDPEDGHAPMVFAVPAEPGKFTDEELKKRIIDRCYKELKTYEVPKYVAIEDELPYTANKKYDFKQMEERGSEYVASPQKREQYRHKQYL